MADEAPSSAIVAIGKGVQIYECVAAASGIAWKLKAPDADLLDVAGEKIGRHFAGPSWQAIDGSKVVGSPLALSQPADLGAIPWLVLKATSHEGSGTFATVTYITLTQTVGGAALATGCDAANVGTESRVPYSAT